MSAISLIDEDERVNWAVKYFEQRKWRVAAGTKGGQRNSTPSDPLKEVISVKNEVKEIEVDSIKEQLKEHIQAEEAVVAELEAVRRNFTEISPVSMSEIELTPDPLDELIQGGEQMLKRLEQGSTLVKEMKELDKRLIDYILYLTK